MTKMLLMDEIHISIYVPRSLPEAECGAIYRSLRLMRFQRQLRQATLGVVRRYAALRKARVTVSR